MKMVNCLSSSRALYLLLLHVVLCAMLAVGCSDSAPSGGESLSMEATSAVDTLWLFDGNTFTGWNGVNDFFRIEDGAVVAGSMERAIPQNEFLCTDARFSDFTLHFVTKMIGERTNAGVQFRTERIPDSNEVIGYQADMGIGWWGSLYDEQRRNRLLATADSSVIASALDPEGWNDYRVEAKGPEINLFINGAQTVHYLEDDQTLEENGRICLQIHSGPPGEVWYRSIWVENLAESE